MTRRLRRPHKSILVTQYTRRLLPHDLKRSQKLRVCVSAATGSQGPFLHNTVSSIGCEFQIMTIHEESEEDFHLKAFRPIRGLAFLWLAFSVSRPADMLRTVYLRESSLASHRGLSPDDALFDSSNYRRTQRSGLLKQHLVPSCIVPLVSQ